jgi:hypothetical protein
LLGRAGASSRPDHLGIIIIIFVRHKFIAIVRSTQEWPGLPRAERCRRPAGAWPAMPLSAGSIADGDGRR